MATGGESKDPMTLDCPVCLERFAVPRVLPCLHTVCEKCLCMHIESQVKGGALFYCPICQLPTAPLVCKPTKREWASTFPINNLIISLMKSRAKLNETDQICEPCKEKGETLTAMFWCNECQEKFCDSCQEFHKFMKLSRNHHVVKIDEMKEASSQNMHISFNEDCVEHNGKPLEVFCVDHRVLCCVACLTSIHCKCNTVLNIDDIVVKQEEKIRFSAILSDFRLIETEVDKLLDEKSENVTEISQECQQIIQDMDDMMDRVIAKLNALRKKFGQQTKQLHEGITNSLSGRKTHIQRFKKNIANSRKMLEGVQNQSSLRNKFITFEQIRSQIISHYQHLTTSLRGNERLHIRLKPEKRVIDLEHHINSLARLGAVEMSVDSPTTSMDYLKAVDKAITELSNRTKLRTGMCAAQVQTSDLSKSIQFVKAIGSRELGARTFFSGGTCLSDGRLVMADYNHNRLVQFDSSYNVVNVYITKDKPTDVTKGTSDNELYVAFKESYICKCTLDSDLTIFSGFKAPTDTWGISMIGDNIIVGTTDAVVILSKEGTIQRSIPKSGDFCYVTVSPTQNVIYYTDNNNIVCSTLLGKELKRYKHEHLETPRGIAVDTCDFVYVCGQDSHNLYQVSLAGRRSKILLEKLKWISKPYSVIFHAQRSELIVTSTREDTVFEVYKLN